MSNVYPATGLIGGASGDLDNIDGADLADQDGAIVITESAVYTYHLDDDSAAGEDSPQIIAPDDNPGDKRWLLKNGVFADVISYGDVSLVDGSTVGVVDGPLITFDGDNDYLEISGCYVGLGTAVPGQIIDARSVSSVIGDARFNVLLFDDTAMDAGVGAGIVFGGQYQTGGAQTTFAGIWGEKENADTDDFAGQLHLGTRVAAGTISSDLIIDSLGRIGVGTILPNDIIHVSHATDAVITIQRYNNAEGGVAGMKFKITQNEDDDYYYAGILTRRNAASSLDLFFPTQSTEGELTYDLSKFTILNGGNVGVNTLTPDAKFQVVGNCKFGEDTTNHLSLATNGEIRLYGTARVNRHLRIGAVSFFKLSDPPEEDVVGVVPVLRFSDATVEQVFYSGVIPFRLVSGTTINVEIDWCYGIAPDSTDPDAGQVAWKIDFLNLATGEVVATAATTIEGLSAASQDPAKRITTVFTTGITGAVAKDVLGIRLYRDTTDEDDDLAVDACFIQLYLYFIMDKLGEPTT